LSLAFNNLQARGRDEMATRVVNVLTRFSLKYERVDRMLTGPKVAFLPLQSVRILRAPPAMPDHGNLLAHFHLYHVTIVLFYVTFVLYVVTVVPFIVTVVLFYVTNVMFYVDG
jgi:hypothetical protein